MATKQELVKTLRAAKSGHMKWLSFVQILVRNGDVDTADVSIPVNFTMCDFGKWYYGEGQNLSLFRNYEDLELPHQMIHDIYMQVYNLYKNEEKGSFFKSSKKIQKERDENVTKLINTMNDYSKILFEALKGLEDDILSLSDEQIDQLNNMTLEL